MRTLRSEGPSVFRLGLNATLLRAFPTNAATLLVYTLLMRALQPKSSGTGAPNAHTIVASGLE